MTNLSVIRYRAPVIKITLCSQLSRTNQNFGSPISYSFVPQPDDNAATIPALIATTTYSGVGVVTTLAGSAPAAGTNVASSGGLIFSGSFPSSSFDPKTAKTYADTAGVLSNVGYLFTIATTFSTGMPSAGATAVLYSDTGSPAWVGISVPLNGSFRLDPNLFVAGEVLRVRVTPAAPSAHLIGYSNEIPFNGGVKFKRAARTNCSSGDSNATVTGTTNYIWFSGQRGSTFIKLFRMNKSTEVVEQVVNNRGDSVTDATLVLGAIGDVVFFANNTTTGGNKLFSITESLVITQLSNHTNNQTTSDSIALITPVDNRDTIQSTSTLFFNSNLYFTALNSSGTGFRKLFRVNGSGTIVQVTNTNGNQAVADMATASVTVFNGALYSVQNNASNVIKLFKITSADVVTQIGDHRNAAATSDAIVLRRATTNFMYYVANNSTGFLKTYRINTSDTPAQILNLANNQGASDSYNTTTQGFAAFNECFYFYGGSPTRLYKVNDAGTTLINVGSPFVENNLGGSGDSNQATMGVVGSRLFISMIGLDGAMGLFYITTSSDTLVRADQTNPITTIQSHQFDTSFTASGRDFICMTGVTEGMFARAFYEVLSGGRLRQLAANNTGTFTLVAGVKGHVSGSDIWFPITGFYNGLNVIVKMTLS